MEMVWFCFSYIFKFVCVLFYSGSGETTGWLEGVGDEFASSYGKGCEDFFF